MENQTLKNINARIDREISKVKHSVIPEEDPLIDLSRGRVDNRLSVQLANLEQIVGVKMGVGAPVVVGLSNGGGVSGGKQPALVVPAAPYGEGVPHQVSVSTDGAESDQGRLGPLMGVRVMGAGVSAVCPTPKRPKNVRAVGVVSDNVPSSTQAPPSFVS